MSDTPTPPESPPRWRWRPPVDRWRPKLRWFAAEYLIVVLGVLTAVGINAWWQGRQDAAAEQVYLQQLHRDLLETERIVIDSDSFNTVRLTRGIQLERAFFLPERPPADSVLAWLRDTQRLRTARPVTGTVEALIATGDLALIQNDSLRSAITAYLDNSRTHVRVYVASGRQARDNLNPLIAQFNPVDLLRAGRTPGELDSLSRTDRWPLPPGDHRDPFAIDLETLLNNRAAYIYLREANEARDGMERARAWMLRDARALREQVESEMNR